MRIPSSRRYDKVYHMYRRTATKVQNGQVQRKNNWEQSPHMFYTRQNEIEINRARPGKGYTHLFRQKDIHEFIKLIPHWEKHSFELDGIFLGHGDVDYLGCYSHSVITLTAWDNDIIWENCRSKFVREHHKTLELLNIPYEQIDKDHYRVEFTVNSAKAFMLIHIFMHELGHHLDRMTSRRQEYCGRGEEFAENWALIHEAEMYERYCRYYRI